jgi:hypothetical protein
MARRGGTHWYRCAQEGCRESGCMDYSNQREYAEAAEWGRKWRCSRHDNPERVLGPDNTARRHVMVVTQQKYGRYWAEESAERGSMGLLTGPGFKAFADDFPVGTRLVVTAYVETPEQAAIAAELDGAS